MNTLKELTQNALDVQSAINLSGVIHSFSRDITALRELMEVDGGIVSTTMINQHPICILYSTQIAFLTGTSGVGCENTELYRKAYEWAQEVVKK